MRLVIKSQIPNEPKLATILPFIKNQIGLIFTNDHLATVVRVLQTQLALTRVKAGNIAEQDIIIPKGGTGLDPGKTSGFSAHNIATRICRGQIEIITDVLVTQKGHVVSSSVAMLLKNLDIRPSVALKILYVYDRERLYSGPLVDLEMTSEQVTASFLRGVRVVSALSLVIGFPCQASAPILIAKTFRKLTALTLAIGYVFKLPHQRPSHQRPSSLDIWRERQSRHTDDEEPVGIFSLFE